MKNGRCFSIYLLDYIKESARIANWNIWRVDGKYIFRYWETHSNYILSEHWKKIRDAQWQKDEGICQLCGQRTIGQIHHISYPFGEQDETENLVTLCPDCHQFVESVKRRITACSDLRDRCDYEDSIQMIIQQIRSTCNEWMEAGKAPPLFIKDPTLAVKRTINLTGFSFVYVHDYSRELKEEAIKYFMDCRPKAIRYLSKYGYSVKQIHEMTGAAENKIRSAIKGD